MSIRDGGKVLGDAEVRRVEPSHPLLCGAEQEPTWEEPQRDGRNTWEGEAALEGPPKDLGIPS